MQLAHPADADQADAWLGDSMREMALYYAAQFGITLGFLLG